MSPCSIRPLTATDRPGWDRLWTGYLDFYRATISPKIADVTFARLTDATEPMGGFLALDAAGRAIGLVHWITHRSCWTVNDYCYLQDLYIEPGQRGGGIGRRLIETVYDHARALGCSRVHWLTQSDNHDAMQLYNQLAEQSGFIQYRKIF